MKNTEILITQNKNFKENQANEKDSGVNNYMEE